MSKPAHVSRSVSRLKKDVTCNGLA